MRPLRHARRSRSRVTPVLCLVGAFCVAAGACRTGAPGPAALDPRNDACASCRMAVSDPKLAAQIVVPGEEPRFFDDIGCLSTYLRDHRVDPEGAVFVADHRTGRWVAAATAVFTRVDAIDTPMGSHLVAHADAGSREADPSARTGHPVAPAEILGPAK